jgi:hypothetical protein
MLCSLHSALCVHKSQSHDQYAILHNITVGNQDSALTPQYWQYGPIITGCTAAGGAPALGGGIMSCTGFNFGDQSDAFTPGTTVTIRSNSCTLTVRSSSSIAINHYCCADCQK